MCYLLCLKYFLVNQILTRHEERRRGMISELTKKFPESINKIETAIMGEDYVFPAKEMIFE